MTNWGFLNRDLALSAQYTRGKSLRLKNEQGLVPKIVKRGENRKKKSSSAGVHSCHAVYQKVLQTETNHVTKYIDYAQVGKNIKERTIRHLF